VTALALVHGAGDSSRVWRHVQERLAGRPSIAIDLLGRFDRPFDLTAVTPEAAAEVAVADILAGLAASGAAGSGIVLVGHSAGAVIVPRIAAALGNRVRHIVFIAGVLAPQGGQAIDLVHPERRAEFEARRPKLFSKYHGHTLVRRGVTTAPEGLVAFDDARIVQAIDSLNLLFRPVSWNDVPAVARTFIRCMSDPIQTPAMQERLMAASGATEIIEIDADHTPARSQPDELAALLESIAARYDVRTA
jgi:pimeloyl-ACP methyl ester carboxylesterase